MKYFIAVGTILRRTQQSFKDRLWSKPLRTTKPVTYDEIDVVDTYTEDGLTWYIFVLPLEAAPYTYIRVAANNLIQYPGP